MKTFSHWAIILTVLLLTACNRDNRTYAEIETNYGTIRVMLYNTTPLHRDNFIALANENFYDSLLFHRVLNGFMIQGGDPDSKDAPQSQRLGLGGPGYEINPEIGAPHLKGTLAAARNTNPQKRSSGSQFYIVQGQPIDDAYLDQIEHQKGITYSPEQRQLYKEIGGSPFLDMDYTVFGEVVEGIEVVDKIAAVATDGNDRPLESVWMKVRILN